MNNLIGSKLSRPETERNISITVCSQNRDLVACLLCQYPHINKDQKMAVGWRPVWLSTSTQFIVTSTATTLSCTSLPYGMWMASVKTFLTSDFTWGYALVILKLMFNLTHKSFINLQSVVVTRFPSDIAILHMMNNIMRIWRYVLAPVFCSCKVTVNHFWISLIGRVRLSTGDVIMRWFGSFQPRRLQFEGVGWSLAC